MDGNTLIGDSLANTLGLVIPVDYVVSSNQDSANLSDNDGNGVVDQDSAVPGRQTSLRAAIRDSRLNEGDTTSIYMPRGKYNLTLSGSGDSDAYGDLHIDKMVTIIGTGAGATIIDGSTLATRDRIFEVKGGGMLDLSRVTLTGGQTTVDGGAIRVNANPSESPELFLREVAIIGNRAVAGTVTIGSQTFPTGYGGAIYVEPGADAVIYRSVITDNTAERADGGGGIYAGGGTTGATVTLDQSVIAKNNSGNGNGADLLSVPIATFISGNGGGNLITSVAGSNLNAQNLQATDYTNLTPGFVAPNYLVTSLVDSYDQTDDARARSIRDAVFHTNSAAGQSIWLPAWGFMLTRPRTTPANQSELDISQGDIEITKSLTVRGAGVGQTMASVSWRSGLPNDAIFDLLGDYNNDGQADYNNVSSADYTIWRDTLGSTMDLRGDGDDDGIVDQADYDVWRNHSSNRLTLVNVDEVA